MFVMRNFGRARLKNGAQARTLSKLWIWATLPVVFLLPHAGRAEVNTDSSPPNSGAISEILVTAEKVTERLQDVPVPMAVVSTETLTESNQVLLRDYYSTVPGLDIHPDIVGQDELSFRGIQGGTITIDDVPFAGSTFYTAGNYLPDVDPGDLERIEVLRGPQGTLYGANSMGGLVRFITKDPSTTAFSGRVEAGTSSVYNGSAFGYNLRASANIPVTDTFALRVSAYERQDPGYIDDPAYQLKAINEANASGARVAGLWQATDAVTLKFSALYQYYRSNGASEVDVAQGLGPWQVNYLPNVGGLERRVGSYSATLTAKLGGGVELTSVTAYGQDHSHASLDFSYAFGSSAYQGFGVTGAPYFDDEPLNKVSEEVRLQGSIGSRLDWLMGGFFADERDNSVQPIYAENPTSFQLVGMVDYYGNLRTFREYAGFADVTYHFTDQLDVQIGGRETFDRGMYGLATQYGSSVGPTPEISPAEFYKNNAFTYLVTPRLRLSQDLMVYARFASGFQPGGPNVSVPGVPPQSDPQKTQSYEFGIKAQFFDDKLSIDSSLYFINIDALQLSLTDLSNGFGYAANGGRAKSEGVDLSLISRPLTGLTLSGWVTYDEAVLVDMLPSNSTVVGYPGEQLPIAPRYSGQLSIQKDFPLGDHISGFVSGAVNYVGSRYDAFVAAPPRQYFPAYTRTDLRAGVKYDSWTVSAYANNAGNVRGYLSGGAAYDPPNAYTYITPRTVGVTATKEF